MEIEKNLDQILNILYDENLLHWKEIPATDIIAFAKRKFNIDWSASEMNFILTMLQNDGYIVLNKVDPNSMAMPTFSLTTKGVQMKRKGGFTKAKLVDDFKNFIIVWGTIIGLIVGIMTIVDLSNKFFCKEKIEKKCPCGNTKEHRDKQCCKPFFANAFLHLFSSTLVN